MSYDSIKKLDESFIGQEISAICCSLKDVIPVDDVSKWSAKACDLLKTLISTKCIKFEVIIHPNDEEIFDITLNRYNESGKYCVNAQLVAYKLAKSIGPESDPKKMIAESAVNTSKIKKARQNKKYGDYVVVAYIKNPTEFYVSLKYKQDEFLKKHDEIQKLMCDPGNGLRYGDEALSVLEDGQCLVYARVEPIFYSAWYRGTIVNAVGDDSYTVFLRDKGCVVTVDKKDIAEIPKNISIYENAVLKCSLAGIKPTIKSLTWSLTSIDFFKQLVSQYQKLCVTLYGKKDENNSHPVIMYGMKTIFTSALETETRKWTQINEELVYNGIAKLSERLPKFIGTDTSIDSLNDTPPSQLIKDIEAHQNSNEATENTFFIQTEPREIECWRSAPPIRKSVFTCKPTYVDDEANIYIQDNSNMDYINQLKRVINENIRNIGKFKALPEDVTNKPCLVRYHIDKEFYRGKILRRIDATRTRPMTYEVQFVDYGNVDECVQEEDISLEVIAYNVPLFVNKVQLYGKFLHDIIA